jgi:micrococcal nuclease
LISVAGKIVLAIVLTIWDGDTFDVRFLNGVKDRIRIIGIDAPEATDNPKAWKDAKNNPKSLRRIIAKGKRSARFLQSVLRKGDTVELTLESKQRDKYNRLLAHVWYKDVSIDSLMVAKKFAKKWVNKKTRHFRQ